MNDSSGRKAERRFLPMQTGDVHETYPDIDAIRLEPRYKPATSIKVGVPRFVAWYKNYCGIGYVAVKLLQQPVPRT